MRPRDPRESNQRRNIAKLLADRQNNSNLYAYQKLHKDAVVTNKARVNQSSGRAQSLKRSAFQNNHNISKNREGWQTNTNGRISIVDKYQSKSVMGHRKPKQSPNTGSKEEREHVNNQISIVPNRIDFNQQNSDQNITIDK